MIQCLGRRDYSWWMSEPIQPSYATAISVYFRACCFGRLRRRLHETSILPLAGNSIVLAGLLHLRASRRCPLRVKLHWDCFSMRLPSYICALQRRQKALPNRWRGLLHFPSSDPPFRCLICHRSRRNGFVAQAVFCGLLYCCHSIHVRVTGTCALRRSARAGCIACARAPLGCKSCIQRNMDDVWDSHRGPFHRHCEFVRGCAIHSPASDDFVCEV
jgi:hypothetical protein